MKKNTQYKILVLEIFSYYVVSSTDVILCSKDTYSSLF